MNEKKAKALRRAIRADGFPKVEMGKQESFNPITFRYPATSFQRVYRDSKR